MATTVDRDKVVPLLIAEFQALVELCRPFTDEDWNRPTCLPGWTVKDVLSHLLGTEAMLHGEQAPSVDVSGLDHVKNPTAEFNEAWVESLRATSGSDILERFKSITDQRAAALEAMSQEDFDQSSWTPAGPDETYGRFMRIRHYDCFLHELDIRDAVGAADREDPAHVELALEEPVAALGYIVGRKAGMPQGTSVRLQITGPVHQTHHVVVEERARVVESLEGEPTVALTVPALLFLRLTGGRRDPLPYVGDAMTLEGDAALAAQLATGLAYTI